MLGALKLPSTVHFERLNCVNTLMTMLSFQFIIILMCTSVLFFPPNSIILFNVIKKLALVFVGYSANIILLASAQKLHNKKLNLIFPKQKQNTRTHTHTKQTSISSLFCWKVRKTDIFQLVAAKRLQISFVMIEERFTDDVEWDENFISKKMWKKWQTHAKNTE